MSVANPQLRSPCRSPGQRSAWGASRQRGQRVGWPVHPRELSRLRRPTPPDRAARSHRPSRTAAWPRPPGGSRCRGASPSAAAARGSRRRARRWWRTCRSARRDRPRPGAPVPGGWPPADRGPVRPPADSAARGPPAHPRPPHPGCRAADAGGVSALGGRRRRGCVGRWCADPERLWSPDPAPSAAAAGPRPAPRGVQRPRTRAGTGHRRAECPPRPARPSRVRSSSCRRSPGSGETSGVDRPSGRSPAGRTPDRRPERH